MKQSDNNVPNNDSIVLNLAFVACSAYVALSNLNDK